jgi:hypothetical protein
MWLQICWRRRKTLAGYIPFDRKMDTSRLPSALLSLRNSFAVSTWEGFSKTTVSKKCER